MTGPINWHLLKERFFEALMAGDLSASLAVSASLASADQLGSFHRYVIQPALYDIGEAWAQGKISVSQEHQSSAIVGRVLSSLNTRFIRPVPSKGRGVVSALPNEYHELGAWILADMLEHDGWEISYLGANAAESTILDTITRFKPHLLALSITMYISVEYARQIIASIRRSEMIAPPAVLVGGFAVNSKPDLWREIGAHGHAEDVEKAVIFARHLWDMLPAERRL